MPHAVTAELVAGRCADVACPYSPALFLFGLRGCQRPRHRRRTMQLGGPAELLAAEKKSSRWGEQRTKNETEGRQVRKRNAPQREEKTRTGEACTRCSHRLTMTVSSAVP